MDLELWPRGLSCGVVIWDCEVSPWRQAVKLETGFRRRSGKTNGRYWHGGQDSIFLRF